MRRRVLIAVTHLLGVGHLTRAAALGRGLAQAGWRVVLVTGGRPAPLVRTDGMELRQLPPVHCRGTDFRTLLASDGRIAADDLLAQRRRLLVRAWEETRPDVVVTETFPFGRRQLAAEFLALLEAARRDDGCAVLSSIRDILNPPSSPAKAVQAQERLGRFYDGVLVHGDPSVATLDVSWPTDDALARRLAYTGYIAESGPSGAAPATNEILVSGGGSAAGLPLFRAAAQAAAGWTGGQRWRLLVGHGVAQEDYDALAAQAGPRLAVERARADFPRLLGGAALSVAQAGYNTMIDVARAGVPAVAVPFEQGNEAEQRLRADRFAAAGRVVLLAEAALDAPRLAAAARAALDRPPRRLAPLDLDGVAKSTSAVEAAARDAGRRRAGWAALRRALDRAPGRVDFWWRDDDAAVPGPELDRLLALAAHRRVPLALAVIPGRVRPELAQRLAGEAGTTVLVHGIAHRNNAPPDARKQELGFRPASELAAALGRSLAALTALFGARCLPVLVPPWNRIAPDLLPLLPDLGYRGLSASGPLATEAPLVQAHAQIDPIDWKGGGGLGDTGALLARLAACVEQGKERPIGLLTHHLVHDAWTWHFLDRLLEYLGTRANVRFLGGPEVFRLR